MLEKKITLLPRKNPMIKLKIRHNAHFSLQNLEMLKTRLHSTRDKRKRCYDVRLSRQEGSTRRHLGSAQYYGPASRWKHRMSFSDVWRASLRQPVKHIVHWIGCINAKKSTIRLVYLIFSFKFTLTTQSQRFFSIHLTW